MRTEGPRRMVGWLASLAVGAGVACSTGEPEMTKAPELSAATRDAEQDEEGSFAEDLLKATEPDESAKGGEDRADTPRS